MIKGLSELAALDQHEALRRDTRVVPGQGARATVSAYREYTCGWRVMQVGGL